ncbi:CUE domain-containing protein 1 [Halotydeus destructor]|nr:CUE domain-containing protein 1 [Halotydeus destructor]
MATTEDEQAAASVTQLEFHQAMQDFKTMFPEMDIDVIEVVLRSNNGAVDATIDQLLAMNEDSEKQKAKAKNPNQLIALGDEFSSASPPNYRLGMTPPPTYSQAVPSEHPHSRVSEQLYPHKFPCASANVYRSSDDSLRAKFKWNPPLLGQLPPSFLRIEASGQYSHSSMSGNSSRRDTLSSALLQQKMEENERRRLSETTNPELNQYLEDERIAILMQNEEFIQELRHNHEFMSTLDLPGGPSASGHDSDAAFKEKLRKMSKASRKKFAQLATMFNRKKKGNFQHLIGVHGHHGSNPSRDNLLMNNDDEYNQLHNEDDDERRAGRQWDNRQSDRSPGRFGREPRVM